MFVPDMEVFLIDSWDLIKQDKQYKFLRQAVQGNLFHLSIFLRQAVSVSWKKVPLEYFPQTGCLGMLIIFIKFLRQPVTVLGKLVQHENFSQTRRLNFNYTFIYK